MALDKEDVIDTARALVVGLEDALHFYPHNLSVTAEVMQTQCVIADLKAINEAVAEMLATLEPAGFTFDDSPA